MIRITTVIIGLTVSFATSMPARAEENTTVTAHAPMSTIELPPPDTRGTLTLEQTLLTRRSVREYRRGSLTLAQVSQLLWAAQGTTSRTGFRTAPSAGALYPLEVYLVAGDVEGLAAGVYRYASRRHELHVVSTGDERPSLANAALGQACVKDAAATLALLSVHERTTGKYGNRGIRYAHIEAGHAAQNILLQAVALGLGAVPVGAFDDDAVTQVLGPRENAKPLYLVPVGRL
jgi:SagB-type dehydrogenase family enzyme